MDKLTKRRLLALAKRLRDWGHPDWFYVDTDILENNQSVRFEAAEMIELIAASLRHSEGV